MKVNYTLIRTPDEELEHLRELYQKNGDYYVWDVSPLVHKTRLITDQKIMNKIKKLVASEEWQDCNPP